MLEMLAVLNIGERIDQKEKETLLCFNELNEAAAVISKNRNKQINSLEEKVNRLLVQVGMPNARLKVSIENKVPDFQSICAGHS